MKILLACSKTMVDVYNGQSLAMSTPMFMAQATDIALDLNSYSASQLQQILKVNGKLATLNKKRYADFGMVAGLIPAIFAYTGTAYKALNANSFSAADIDYAQQHLLIASFLYGLLRPLDGIHPYRLEGNVELPVTGHSTIFEYWRPMLTDWFIAVVKADGGILVNLASNEFRQIFDWNKITSEVTVINPEFKTDYGSSLKTVIVYAKMCRGAMTQWIIKNRIDNPDDLKEFEFEGFRWYGGSTFVMQP